MNSENRNIAEANIAIHARRLWMAFCCLFATSVVLNVVQSSLSVKNVAGVMEIPPFATSAIEGMQAYAIQNSESQDPAAEICQINLFSKYLKRHKVKGWIHFTGKISKRTTENVHLGTACMPSLAELPRPPNP